MGLDFRGSDQGPRGPDLLRIIRSLPQEAVSKDIRQECFDGIEESERPKQGEWLAIWGGNTALHQSKDKRLKCDRFICNRLHCSSARKVSRIESDCDY